MIINSFDLSDRQLCILKKIALCSNAKQIALDLKVSVKTVEFHVAKLKKKLNLQSHEELVRFAYENGLVSKGERAVIRESKPLQVTPEIDIASANELTDALMKAAKDAANGNANVLQVNALCQATNTLINFARLQMEVLERQGGRLPKWLIAGSIELNGKHR